MKKVLSVLIVFIFMGFGWCFFIKTPEKGTFGYDLKFLQKYHSNLVVLENAEATSKLIILPDYQARVMTSTSAGNKGVSYGWINHDLIASGKLQAHINAFGGEDRFWLGPEGGQFSIFFKKGVNFNLDNWQVPPSLDTEAFDVERVTKNEAFFSKKITLENYSGTQFSIFVQRTIRLLSKTKVDSLLGFVTANEVEFVAYETDNVVRNISNQNWDKNTGLLSVWMLGMLNANENTTIIAPYKQGDESTHGKIVTKDYFGDIPNERLKIGQKAITLKADANFRSKIGLSPQRALPFIGSYDAENNVLTIVQYSMDSTKTDYVNSKWEIQQQPFAGDVVNAYNDGPVNGTQLGKFYELESSSSATALAKGESIRHIHRTMHFKANKKQLNNIAEKLLGVGI
jgi:hypothetical protein